jgi:hypothetical protein
MEERIDRLSRDLAQGMSRRKALGLMGAAVGGTFALLTGRAQADPRTCITCSFGVGQPCNVKRTECTEVRGFPSPEQACAPLTRPGEKFCGAGNQFHCPQGCPA